ncbi:hypothetical protein TBR22_A19550 [Luteitalea sp. TBR-22]|nr:hypothetical protein TBR22_A19550 [Luteitalea sp. TBR-22]
MGLLQVLEEPTNLVGEFGRLWKRQHEAMIARPAQVGEGRHGWQGAERGRAQVSGFGVRRCRASVSVSVGLRCA